MIHAKWWCKELLTVPGRGSPLQQALPAVRGATWLRWPLSKQQHWCSLMYERLPQQMCRGDSFSKWTLNPCSPQYNHVSLLLLVLLLPLLLCAPVYKQYKNRIILLTRVTATADLHRWTFLARPPPCYFLCLWFFCNFVIFFATLAQDGPQYNIVSLLLLLLVMLLLLFPAVQKLNNNNVFVRHLIVHIRNWCKFAQPFCVEFGGQIS